MLLSAHVERVSVSRMRDFFCIALSEDTNFNNKTLIMAIYFYEGLGRGIKEGRNVGGSQPWNGMPATQAEEDEDGFHCWEDVVLAEDEDGMKASAVPNQALVSQCSLVTL